MENLSNKIRVYLGREPDFKKEILLRNTGSEDFIFYWGATDKVKPTDDQLNALASDATKLKNNKTISGKRRQAYGDWNDQLDEIYKDIDAWKARIKKIKDDNPKE